MPSHPATVPVDVSVTGPPAGGVVNRDPHPSLNHSRVLLRSPPLGPHRNLNRSRSPGRPPNPRPVPRRSPNHSPARFRNPLRARLRSLSRNLGPLPSPQLVLWPHPPNRSLSRSPARFPRTRSIRQLRLVNPGWAVLWEVSREIARDLETWVA
ncbi:MAG: hypothetical protein ACK6D3_04955 [Planctomycetaceae bacterium]